MSGSGSRLFDPFVSAQLAAAVPGILAARGPLRVYVEGPIKEGFGRGLVRRHDAAIHYLRSRLGREDPVALIARLNLFRETLAIHEDLSEPAVAAIYRSEAFIEAAREMTGAQVVRPAMLYANILLPGQELALHTDTPEYRGLDKWCVPEWFLVVMHHSGLFERWRKRVTAGVAFFSECTGGEFVFYPDGPDGEVEAVPVRPNTAVHLDVDALFHGVARVGGPETPAPPLKQDMTLTCAGGDSWHLGRPGEVAATYRGEELRISVQWKANCFQDAAEEALVASHKDDLTLVGVLERFTQELRQRGRITTPDRPADGALATLLIDEYIRFPVEA